MGYYPRKVKTPIVFVFCFYLSLLTCDILHSTYPAKTLEHNSVHIFLILPIGTEIWTIWCYWKGDTWSNRRFAIELLPGSPGMSLLKPLIIDNISINSHGLFKSVIRTWLRSSQHWSCSKKRTLLIMGSKKPGCR